MGIETGQQLLHYRIVGKLGEGGMGAVWRAVDTTLDREVALKLLPAPFAQDPERLARFEREAKVLASLNHPNIATVHGLHAVPSDDGGPALRFLTMELVAGEDLTERIARGPLPIDEALGFARQIANALAAAHASGVIHRDIKPANIRFTPRGEVKVLDFGLAKALDPATPAAISDPSSSPTMTSTGTVAGLILGTAAYMSPEQARGHAVDRRADVWSFGCVLYEMLTGKQVFRGATVSDMLAAVLRADPDWEALPPETPAPIRRLLRRCLAKDPERRLHDVADARIEIDDAASEPLVPAAPSIARRGPSRLPWVLFALVSLVALAALGRAWLRGESTAALPPLLRFEQKTFAREVIYNARFMPDGRTIVYSSALAGNRPQIFLLQSGAMAPRSIAPVGTHLLSVSASGELAVLTDTTYLNHRIHEGTLGRMTIDGSPRPLVEKVRDADWGPDGELAIVHRVAGKDRLEYPAGRLLYETTGYVSEPRVSADGSRIAFLDHPTGTVYDDRGWVKVVDLEGKVETLTEEYPAIEGLAWVPGDERLLFTAAAIGSDLYQPLVVEGNGRRVSAVAGTSGDLMVVDVASDGRWLAIEMEMFYGIAVRPPGGGTDIDLSWLNQSFACSLSPDGETIVFVSGRGGIDYSILTRRVDGSPITTVGPGDSEGFSPDGRWIAGRLFSTQQIVLYPTGAGETRPLERGPIESYDSAQWFPDSRSLLITANEPSSPLRSYRQPIDGGLPEPVTPEGVYGTLSPRGDRILGRDSGMNWRLYPLDGGPPNVAPGLVPSDHVAAWSPDGAAVYVHGLGGVPLRLERVDLATGTRTPSIAIGPEGQAGLVVIQLNERVLDPNRRIAYTSQRRLSTLFAVEEVRR